MPKMCASQWLYEKKLGLHARKESLCQCGYKNGIGVIGQCPQSVLMPWSGAKYAPGHYQRTDIAKKWRRMLRESKLKVVITKILVSK